MLDTNPSTPLGDSLKQRLTRQEELAREMRESIIAEFKQWIKLPEAALFIEGVLLHSFLFELIRLRMERERNK